MPAKSRSTAMRDRRLWLLLGAALAIRLVLMPLSDPYDADLTTFWRPWMAFAAQHGLPALYLRGEPAVNYPPFYLALLAGLGTLYRLVSPGFAYSPLQSVLIKLPAVVADLAITVLLYHAARLMVEGETRKQLDKGAVDKEPANESQESRPGARPSCTSLSTAPLSTCFLVSPSTFPLAAAALWAFNPAVIYVSAYWAQVDAIHTLWLLAALLAALRARWGWAGIFTALALLTKLQAIVLLPLLLLLAWRWRGLVRLGLGGLATLALGLAPFALTGALRSVVSVYGGSVGYYPRLTVGAYNLWWSADYIGRKLLGHPPTNDMVIAGPVTVRWLSLALFGAYGVLILWALWRSTPPDGPAPATALAVFFAAGMLFFGFFMLPTEIHERYVLPALAFLAPVAWRSRGLLIAYLLLSATILLNVLEVLPFAPWLLRLFHTLKSETLLASLANIALFGWLTTSFVRIAGTRGRKPLAVPAKPQEE